jgi:hypothetical protein
MLPSWRGMGSVGDAVFGFTVRGAHTVLEHFAAKPASMSLGGRAAGTCQRKRPAHLDLLGVAAGDTLLINAAAGRVGAAASMLRAPAGQRDRNRERGKPRVLVLAWATPTTYGRNWSSGYAGSPHKGADYAVVVVAVPVEDIDAPGLSVSAARRRRPPASR